MENEINALQYSTSFPRMGMSVTSTTSRSEIDETNTTFQSFLLESSYEIADTVLDEKPKKILRKLRTVLRREVRVELREEVRKSKNLEDKVDRANVRFKEKVFETLKQAAQRDQTVKSNLEHIRREKVRRKIVSKYKQCRAKLVAEMERRKANEETKRKTQETRRKNMETRMRWYLRQWKRMNDRKCYYREHTRKEMAIMRLCKKGLYVNRTVDCPDAQEPALPRPDPRVRSDMLTLVLHLVTRRAVRHATSHVLCHLLSEAERCIFHISPAHLRKLNKTGAALCGELVAARLREATESYVPSLPPPGFLSNLLQICCHKPTPNDDQSLPARLFKLKCPCRESTPEFTEASVSSLSARSTSKDASLSVKSSSAASVQSMWSTESEVSEDSDEVLFENSSPEMPKSAPTELYQSSSSSTNSVCDSNGLLPSDDSIQYYFKKYNIRHDGTCGEVSSATKYVIRNPQICSANSKTFGTNSDDSKYSLCFQLKTNREPLTSNNIYDLLHNEKLAWEDDPCNPNVVVEKVKVPKKVNPIEWQKKLKPTNTVQPRKAPKKSAKQKPTTSLSTTSDIFVSSLPNAGSIYWLFNSLNFLSTTFSDLLCNLISTLRPPLKFNIERLERFSQMEAFEEFLCALFEKNFDVINNDSLVFLVEKLFYFVWLTPYRCPAVVWETRSHSFLKPAS